MAEGRETPSIQFEITLVEGNNKGGAKPSVEIGKTGLPINRRWLEEQKKKEKQHKEKG